MASSCSKASSPPGTSSARESPLADPTTLSPLRCTQLWPHHLDNDENRIVSDRRERRHRHVLSHDGARDASMRARATVSVSIDVLVIRARRYWFLRSPARILVAAVRVGVTVPRAASFGGISVTVLRALPNRL